MDEGEPCTISARISGTSAISKPQRRNVTKSYGRPDTFTVTLTVTDSRGGVSSTKQSLTINGRRHRRRV
jgi:hypothetical protein